MLKIKSTDDFNVVKNTLINNKETFSIEKKANKRSVFIANQRRGMLYTSEKLVREHFSHKTNLRVIPEVHKQIDSYILRQNMIIEEIPKDYTSMKRDSKAFKDIEPGTRLMNVDIRHAYWRMALNLGYINREVYNKYVHPDFKLTRNIALSTLASRQEREIYVNGEFQYNIECFNAMRQTIYKNICRSTCNLTGELHELLGDASFGYRIDGVLVVRNDEVINFCTDYFRKNKVLSEVKVIEKVDDRTILEVKNGKVKKF
jgi:hypothetical protein